MKRSKLTPSSSKALFTNTAKRPHPKNTAPAHPRGGHRL